MALSTPQAPVMSPKPARGIEPPPPEPPVLLVLPVAVPAPPALLVASVPPAPPLPLDPVVALAEAAVVLVDAGSLEQASPEIASERRRSKADEAGRGMVMVAPSYVRRREF